MPRRKAADQFESDLAESLEKEFEHDLPELFGSAIAAITERLAPDPFQTIGRLPRRIPGGFTGLADDLDRRSREWRNIHRLLEQQRPYLERAEAERDRLYTNLEEVMARVQESNASFKDSIERTKAGDISADLSAQFGNCFSALEDLERVAGSLTVNLLDILTCWEQYATTVIKAHRMRQTAPEESGKMGAMP